MNLARKTIVGVVWNLLEHVLRRGIDVGVTILLAYFLTPHDFGLLAMMAVFLSLGATLMESGLKQALIRLKQPKQVDLSTAFYTNIVFGLAAYLLLFTSATFIAKFYQQQELVALIRVAAVGVVINSLQLVQVAILNRNLDFKVLLHVNLPSTVLSGCAAVALSYMGLGVWSLVVQMLLSSFFITLLLWFRNIWRPTLEFSFKSLKSLYGFGFNIFLSGVLEITFKNMYVVIIAKFFHSNVVGWYFFTERVKDLVIGQLVSSIQTVTYPALSTMGEDRVRLKEGYRKIVVITSFLLFPLILFIAALAQPVFELLLPVKWWPATTYLQLMLLAGVLIPIHTINLNILLVKGRSDLFLYLELMKKSMLVLIFWISFKYGVVGILIGQIVSSILAYVPNAFFSFSLIGYNIKEQLRDFLPPLIVASVVAVVIYRLQLWLDWSPLLKLVVLGILAIFLYIASARHLRLGAYRLVWDIVRINLDDNRVFK